MKYIMFSLAMAFVFGSLSVTNLGYNYEPPKLPFGG